MRSRILSIICLLVALSAFSQTDLPKGYWDIAQTDPILKKTRTIILSPDLAGLTAGEKTAVEQLLKAGEVMQALYEQQLHPEALYAFRQLQQLDQKLASPVATQNLLALYRLFEGPIATTLENKQEPFLPVAPPRPGKNLYPLHLGKAEIEEYLRAHPDQKGELLNLRSVVREATKEMLWMDLRSLHENPVIDGLHPGLRGRLEQLLNSPSTPEKRLFYSVPYSVAYPVQLRKCFDLLWSAADVVQKDDEAFARYLRHRARDLLADDYDAGDATWVTSRFKHLNAQIGSYETYDDALFGVKTFFSFSLLLKDESRSKALEKALEGIQEIQDALPYEAEKTVRENIPVGVYEVIADFGQARGINSATILPNESHLARQFGRTILLRSNILLHPELWQSSRATFEAVINKDQHSDLKPEGTLQRILWHEIGHYLGPDRTKDERDLDVALEENADLLEELKSDLVSLFSVPQLIKNSYYNQEAARNVYASGILRVLLKVKPRRDQAYGTMQLMQWNYFLQNGALKFDPASGTLTIDYEQYPQAVESMLRDVIDLQYSGDKAKANAFIDRYAVWDEKVQGALSAKMRTTEKFRFTIVRYAALGE